MVIRTCDISDWQAQLRNHIDTMLGRASDSPNLVNWQVKLPDTGIYLKSSTEITYVTTLDLRVVFNEPPGPCIHWVDHRYLDLRGIQQTLSVFLEHCMDLFRIASDLLISSKDLIIDVTPGLDLPNVALIMSPKTFVEDFRPDIRFHLMDVACNIASASNGHWHSLTND